MVWLLSKTLLISLFFNEKIAWKKGLIVQEEVMI